MKRFASSDEGAAELVTTWGKDAGRKVATIRARVDRMLRSGGDMDAAARWLDGLSPAEAKSIWKALAG